MKFLLTSDWHLRPDKPKCRLDEDWLQTQADFLNYIKNLQLKYNCDILHAGDLFNSCRVSREFEAWSIENIGAMRIISVAGNHDLPYHSLLQYKDSSLRVLEATHQVILLKDDANNILTTSQMIFTGSNVGVYGFNWGENIDNKLESIEINKNFYNIAVLHYFVYNDNPNYAIEEIAIRSNVLLKKFIDKGFNFILTGHNHNPFIIHDKNGWLINPGCPIGQKSNETFEPNVYLLDTDKNEVERIIIPYKSSLIDSSYIEIEKARDERIDQFVSKLETNYSIDLNYIDNLENFFLSNNTQEEVRNLILNEFMEGVKNDGV